MSEEGSRRRAECAETRRNSKYCVQGGGTYMPKAATKVSDSKDEAVRNTLGGGQPSSQTTVVMMASEGLNLQNIETPFGAYLKTTTDPSNPSSHQHQPTKAKHNTDHTGNNSISIEVPPQTPLIDSANLNWQPHDPQHLHNDSFSSPSISIPQELAGDLPVKNMDELSKQNAQ